MSIMFFVFYATDKVHFTKKEKDFNNDAQVTYNSWWQQVGNA